jgi:hypothetical protein
MVKSTYITVALLLFLPVTLGQKTSVSSHENIDKLLRSFAERGMSYHFLDNDTIEIADTLMGWKEIKTLWQPDEATIRSWAATRYIPVIEIDPTQVDTSKWAEWFEYWTNVPVGNDVRIPTMVRDFDSNGYPEVYGNFGGVGFPQSRVYEVYHDGSSALLNDFGFGSISTQITDVDRNGLWEIVLQRMGVNYFFEQSSQTSIPTELKFAYNKFEGVAPTVAREYIVHMNADSVVDFVHRGGDTALSPYNLTTVSSYVCTISNFVRAWCMVEDGLGYDVGDYDCDGRMEMLSGGLWGALYVVESQGGAAYGVTFRDTLPLVNMFYQSSGDVDHDGRREFFVAATMSSGNWTVMYETDTDNHFTPRVALHLLSGGTLDDPTYIAEDVDGDGIVELTILSGGYLYIFKSNYDDSYYLWYMKRGPASFTFSFHDMNGDGIQDILWTNIRNSSWVSDIFVGSPLMSVESNPPLALPQKAELLQNYPNPFNPSTTVTFSLPRRDYVMLAVYDILGREVARLADGAMDAGTHRISWDAARVTSGVYLYRLRTSGGTISRKMIIVK